MDTDLDALATALYVRVDDLLLDRPELVPPRPRIGLHPKLSDAELVTLSVLQVLLGFEDEARWVRYAKAHFRHLFPYVPGQSGYNKRLRKAASMLRSVMRILATDIDAWADDTWLIDSTPVECGRSRPTAQRSNLAGWAGYGYCASHSRYFWGLRLHLVTTPAGLPVAFALANPKTDERDVALDIFEADPELLAGRAGQTLVADKGYASAEFERRLAEHGIDLVRPAMKRERRRPGARQLRRSARSSSPSTWNATAATAPRASPPASSNASSPSPPPSGTTTTPASPYSAPSPPTTTDPLDFHV
jgi:hypothetical protein